MAATAPDESIRKLIAHGEALWTEDEGSALEDLKNGLDSICDLARPEAQAPLKVLAAVLPAFWMVGEAALGVSLAEPFVPADITDPPPSDARFGAQEDPILTLPLLEPGADASLQSLADTAVPQDLLLACCLDGGGTNAYACTKYGEATRFHATAIFLCDRFLQGVGEEADEQAIAEYGPSASLLRSRAIDGLGRVARESGEYGRALRLHAMSARAASALCSPDEPSQVRHYFRPSPLTVVANAVSNAGVAAQRQGDAHLAYRYHTEARRLRSVLGDLRGTSSSLGNLALLCDSPTAALALYGESLELRVRLGDVWGIAGSHRAIAMQLIARGEHDDAAQAREHLASALPLFAQVCDALGVAESLESLGLLCATQADKGEAGTAANDAATNEIAARAATLLGAALAVRNACGAAADAVMHHASAQALRNTHASAWDRGATMGMEEAVALGAAEVKHKGPAELRGTDALADVEQEERPAKSARRGGDASSLSVGAHEGWIATMRDLTDS